MSILVVMSTAAPGERSEKPVIRSKMASRPNEPSPRFEHLAIISQLSFKEPPSLLRLCHALSHFSITESTLDPYLGARLPQRRVSWLSSPTDVGFCSRDLVGLARSRIVAAGKVGRGR